MTFDPKQPLWLPAGSVRAVLALLIVVPLSIVVLRSGIQFSADQVIGLSTLVLSAYFIQKAATSK
jgi:hypothetical protein